MNRFKANYNGSRSKFKKERNVEKCLEKIKTKI
nr:MAG TPA: hypothetical protein [Caudoviricetes sp.]